MISFTAKRDFCSRCSGVILQEKRTEIPQVRDDEVVSVALMKEVNVKCFAHLRLANTDLLYFEHVDVARWRVH